MRGRTGVRRGIHQIPPKRGDSVVVPPEPHEQLDKNFRRAASHLLRIRISGFSLEMLYGELHILAEERLQVDAAILIDTIEGRIAGILEHRGEPGRILRYFDSEPERLSIIQLYAEFQYRPDV